MRGKHKTSGFQRREFFLALLGILPALLLFSAVIIYPQIMNFRYAVTDFDGFSKDIHFVGVDNFVKIFTKDPLVLKAFVNTLFFSIASIVIGTVIQMIVAVIIHNGMKAGNVLKTILYLPIVFSLVILAVIWNSILRYNGLLNNFLKGIGAANPVIDWLGNIDTVMWSLIFINTWMYLGFGVIIFLAGLDSIPTDVIEAATIDGVNNLTKFAYIQFPLMMYSITVILFIGLTGTLNLFELPFVMTQGGPRNATLTIAYNIYNNAFQYNRFGYAAASSITFTLFIGIIAFIQLRLTKGKEVQY